MTALVTRGAIGSSTSLEIPRAGSGPPFGLASVFNKDRIVEQQRTFQGKATLHLCGLTTTSSSVHTKRAEQGVQSIARSTSCCSKGPRNQEDGWRKPGRGHGRALRTPQCQACRKPLELRCIQRGPNRSCIARTSKRMMRRSRGAVVRVALRFPPLAGRQVSDQRDTPDCSHLGLAGLDKTGTFSAVSRRDGVGGQHLGPFPSRCCCPHSKVRNNPDGSAGQV